MSEMRNGDIVGVGHSKIIFDGRGRLCCTEADNFLVSIVRAGSEDMNGEVDMSRHSAILRQRRIMLGMTMKEVAEKANIAQPQYQRFESGKRELENASFGIAYRILKALELDVEMFMEGKYQIKEILYKGYDGRLYYYETGKPVEETAE